MLFFDLKHGFRTTRMSAKPENFICGEETHELSPTKGETCPVNRDSLIAELLDQIEFGLVEGREPCRTRRRGARISTR